MVGLFSRKPKVSIEEFCRDFYDTQIFHSMIAGKDFWSDFLGTIFNSVAEADPLFSRVDMKLFRQEMTALRMEVFGLAWSHRFKRVNLAIAQSLFTRQYLQQNRKLNIWNIMGEYNQAIARSATADANGQPMEGRTGRARIAYINTL